MRWHSNGHLLHTQNVKILLGQTLREKKMARVMTNKGSGMVDSIWGSKNLPLAICQEPWAKHRLLSLRLQQNKTPTVWSGPESLERIEDEIKFVPYNIRPREQNSVREMMSKGKRSRKGAWWPWPMDTRLCPLKEVRDRAILLRDKGGPWWFHSKMAQKW